MDNLANIGNPLPHPQASPHFPAQILAKRPFAERMDFLPAQRERTWGLYVTGVGRLREPGERPGERSRRQNPERMTRDYSLIYISEGHGGFRGHDTHWQRVVAGDVLVLFPGIRHDYRPLHERPEHKGEKTGGGWTRRWVLFNGELANQWCMQDLLNVDTPVLHVGVRNELIEAFDRLLEIGRAAPPFANQIQAGVTMEILALVLKFYQARHQHQREAAPTVEAALGYIHKNWAQEIDFEVLARKMGTGYRHFRRLFQEATGLAPHQYLLNCRLNQAKRLLGDYSVAEVAARVGFEDPLYFSRIFKRKVGVAPTKWH